MIKFVQGIEVRNILNELENNPWKTLKCETINRNLPTHLDDKNTPKPLGLPDDLFLCR